MTDICPHPNILLTRVKTRPQPAITKFVRMTKMAHYCYFKKAR